MSSNTRTLREALFQRLREGFRNHDITKKIWKAALYANQDRVKLRVERLLKSRNENNTVFKEIDDLIVKMDCSDKQIPEEECPSTSASSSKFLPPKPEECTNNSFSNEINKRKFNDVSFSADTTDSVESVSEESEMRGNEFPKYEMDTNNIAMVVLGPNNTKVPKSSFDKISWNNIHSATRELLDIVFTQDTLATHNLSGKISLPLGKRPAKMQLDRIIVNDIESLLSAKFNLSLKEVRPIISHTCTEAAKRFKRNENNSSI